jgi:HAD superfamily hydrolase (TIGR01509 family)
MDGTLLDLRFDNWFWLELIPRRYATAKGLDLEEARRVLAPRFSEVRGTLQWYCIEHWSRQLGLDVGGIKREELARVGFLPGAREFLSKLKVSGKRVVLVTNAHPITLGLKNEGVALKNEGVALSGYFHACYSTHPFEFPKEQAEFWPRLAAKEGFEPRRTLFVDDSTAVLDAARDYGIGWLRAVRRPDSSQPPQATGEHWAVEGVGELM